MAAILSIRKYSGVVIGFIGVAILAFVLSDLFKSNSQLLRRVKDEVGIIAGQEISHREFEFKYQNAIQSYKNRNQSETIDDATRTQILDQIWQDFVNEIVYGAEYEELGLVVSAEELSELVKGDNPHPWVVQSFTNKETGVFDKSQLIYFLKNLDRDPKTKEAWLDFEKSLLKDAVRQKYFDLIKGSLYVTNLEAKEDYYGKNKFASFQYISLPLKSIPDSTIELDESSILEYYKENKHLYEVEETRGLEYVTFDVIPTKEDSILLLSQLENFKQDFIETNNDSLFVEVNSESDFDTGYYAQGHFPQFVDDTFFIADIGTAIGPYYDANVYKLAKLIDRKEDTVYSYKASHILFKPMGNTDEDTLNALQKARDMMKEIKDDEDFTMKAMMQSEDKGSAIKGGDLGWFQEGAMVKPFMEAVKGGKKGDLVVVKSQFGAHLIKITEDKTNILIKVGIIVKSITPSSQTYKDVYSDCLKFRSKINNSEDFEDVILEFEMIKNIAEEIRPNEKEIPGLHNSKRLISWAYQVKLNDISDIIDFEDKFIVAHLTKLIEEGPAPLENVRGDLESKVLNEKKKELLFNKLKMASDQDNTLKGIAKIVEANVEKASNVSFNVPIIAGIGNEQYLVGQVFGLTISELSGPIRGESAVFYIVLDEYSKVEDPQDFTEIKSHLFSNYQGMSQYETMEALNEIADIKDLRYRFY